MVDYRVDWAKDFNFHATAGFPRSAFAPADLAVNISELIPASPVGEDIPGRILTSPSGDRILEMDHNSTQLLIRFPKLND
jgi:hypothetical protein